MPGLKPTPTAQALTARIQTAIPEYPKLAPLFEDILSYISSNAPEPNVVRNGLQDEGPASKKRKLEIRDSYHSTERESISDVSFSIPQRKKLKLELGRSAESGSLRAVNPSTGDLEFGIPWQEVECVVCVPVPEKAQPAWNFCVFPRGEGDEPILFTIPAGKVKVESIRNGDKAEVTEASKDDVKLIFNTRLRRDVVEPSEKEFVSSVVQAHRKGEKAVHVKAFRGSKDGFLFFLPIGIVFGFKKPLEFFPFANIHSISYTSVLQRTFNLVISAMSSSSSSSQDPKEIEFSMLDQADFASIDAYLKRHQLQDASMAEQRRAKKLNVNGVKKTEGDGEEDGEGELVKAQREADEMEDEDEEEDENFDPGSEGESEGEGSSSEDEDDQVDVHQDGDAVDDELGSEREDVSD